jgi:hypothetical protein
VNVLAPRNVVAPVPSRTKAPLPLITPDKSPEVNAPPTVNVYVCRFTAPLPPKLPTLSFAPSFKIPGEFTVKVPASAIASPPIKVNVPAETVVVPEYKLTPPNVSSLGPFFVKFPVPLTAPFQLTKLCTVTVGLPERVPSPANVNAPLFVVSPNVVLLPMVNAFPMLRAVAESLCTATFAVFNVNVPLPSAVSLPILKMLPAPP